MRETTPALTTLTLCAIAATVGCNGGSSSARKGTAAAVTSATTSQTTTAATTPAPGAPAAQARRGALRVQWPAVAGATTYTLYVADVANVGSALTAVSALPGGRRVDAVTSPHDLVGLTPGRAVHLVVTATGPGGESPPSAEVAAAPLADDWRLESADAAHSGHNVGEVGRAPVAQAWSRTLGGRWTSTPVVARGRLFVVNDERLHALEPGSGAALWTVPGMAYTSVQTSQPAVVGDRVVVERLQATGVFGGLRASYDALDTATGAVVWSTTSSPLLGFARGSVSFVPAGGQLLALDPRSGELGALDLATGDVKWRSFPGPMYYERTAPTVADGEVYLLAYGQLSTLDPLTGAAGQTTTLNNSAFFFGNRAPYVPAIVAGGTVYTALQSELLAVDRATRVVRWRHPANAQVEAPAVADGRVFAVVDGSLDALDAATGAVAWRFIASSALEAQPIVGNGVVFSASGTEVYAIDAATGAQLWKAPTGGRICVAAGHLFVAAPTGGVLTAYRLGR